MGIVIRGVLTFTNLFPSSEAPEHGLFVRERMRRVLAAMRRDEPTAWQVVCPVPRVPMWYGLGALDRGTRALSKNMPDVETVDTKPFGDGVVVHHPRYPHYPALGLKGQALRMAKAAEPVVRQITSGGRWILDAHYLYPDGVAVAHLAEKLGLPFTLTARGSDATLLGSIPAIASQLKFASERAAACFAVSEALGDVFARVASQPRERVELARNGVDLDRFHPGDREEARRSLGIADWAPANVPVILAVGRLASVKGFQRIAAALPFLGDDVRVVLIGEGSERSKLEAAFGPRARVFGAQPPDVVATGMRAANVMCLSSDREGWPNVVTEALASGTPVVATDVGGVPQILTESVSGRVVPFAGGDCAQGLGAALAEVLADPPTPAAVRAFAERYGWKEPVDQLAARFSELFEQSADRAPRDARVNQSDDAAAEAFSAHQRLASDGGGR